MNKNLLYDTVLIATLVCISGTACHAQSIQEESKKHVTVWVHGTSPETLLPSFLRHCFKDQLSYLQASQPGLVKISDTEDRSYARIVAHTLSHTDPIMFPYEHIYQYGWSGDDIVSVRRKSGQSLYHALRELTISYEKKYGNFPRITLISHSHGGNVILHTAEEWNAHDAFFTIDLVLLLGCPIQHETIPHSKSPFFNTIVVVYSKSDIIQILDPQWIQPFITMQKGWGGFQKAWSEAFDRPWFSQRMFADTSTIPHVEVSWICGAPLHDTLLLSLPKKYIKEIIGFSQCVNFLSKKRGLLHIELILPFFLKYLPAIVTEVTQPQQGADRTIHIDGTLMAHFI